MTRCPYHDLPCECAKPKTECLQRASDSPLPPGQPQIDYTSLDTVQLYAVCEDKADRWAKAFIQHSAKAGSPHMDEGVMIGWFANAIEASHDFKQQRATAELVDIIKRSGTYKGWDPFQSDREVDDYLRAANAANCDTPVNPEGQTGSDVGAATTDAVHVQVAELHSDERTRPREAPGGRDEVQVRGAGPLRRLLTRLGITGS